MAARPSLDLCNTRLGDRELLKHPEDLARWMAGAHLGLPAAVPTRRDLQSVTGLRDELREALLGGDRRAVGELAGSWFSQARGYLDVDPESLRPSFCPDGATCRCLVVPALLDALDLAREMLQRVRECAAPDCFVIYLDESRNGSRRWCAMDRCGARSKVQAYLTRQRAAHADDAGEAPPPA